MKKLLVVLNPIAGARRKINLEERVREWMGLSFEVSFLYWETADFDITLAIKNRIKEERFEIVVAAGGDGTVNRTARALVNSDTAFAILPLGSGNGLARHFKIPMNLENAACVIAKGKVIKMDTCQINDENFFCTAGTGFDAHIGDLFANSGKRGFSTYTKIVGREFKNYKSSDYKIIADGKEINVKAFLVTVANANQYGNNVYISPDADITDGLMNVVVLKPFGLIHAPALASRLFLKNMHKATLVETFKAKQVDVFRNDSGPIHFDGEPFVMGNELRFRIFPNSMQIIVP